MARIFTVDFEFRGGSHAAVISMWRGDAQSDVFQAALYDATLLSLVPEGLLRFNTLDGDALPSDPEKAELVACLRKAVKGYLQNIPV